MELQSVSLKTRAFQAVSSVICVEDRGICIRDNGICVAGTGIRIGDNEIGPPLFKNDPFLGPFSIRISKSKPFFDDFIDFEVF